MTTPNWRDRAQAIKSLVLNQAKATKLAERLVEACKSSDGDGARSVFDEATANPDVLMLLLTTLTTRLVKAEGVVPEDRPLHTPEDWGVDMTNWKAETWQVAINDQVEAAVEAGDASNYAHLTTEAMLRSTAIDAVAHREKTGQWLSAEDIVPVCTVMTPNALAWMAAELVRRELMRRLDPPGGG